MEKCIARFNIDLLVSMNTSDEKSFNQNYLNEIMLILTWNIVFYFSFFIEICKFCFTKKYILIFLFKKC